MPDSKATRAWQRQGTCEWQPREVWQPFSPTTELCGQSTPFLVVREDDTDLSLCSTHLATYIHLYGPVKLDTWPAQEYRRKR